MTTYRASGRPDHVPLRTVPDAAGKPKSRRTIRLRPTLRLRVTLFNGVLLAGAGLLLLLLAWMIVDKSLDYPDDRLRPSTDVQLADGSSMSGDTWQDEVRRDLRNELLGQGLLALVVITAAGVAGGYVVAARSLRPLRQVTVTAQRLSTETLDQRIAYSGPDDEVKELADTFDAMLRRLGAAFGSQQRFVANASHELRTPLAVMRTEIDVTLADEDASREELRRMGIIVRNASDRANQLIEALLLLARTEAQAGRRLAKQLPVDLAVGVPITLSAVQAEIKRLDLTVVTELAPAFVVGDPSLLERLAGNLVENAVRYNVQHGQLHIRTGSDGRSAWLTVANTGAELEPEDVPGLFEPFRRGGVERTGTRGAGLGLSIVRAVVDAHGGVVRATPLPDGGLEVTATLPAAAVTPMPSAEPKSGPSARGVVRSA
jgi:signal transduction histidine kinase